MGGAGLNDWTKSGKVRARITDEGALEVRCFGLTTQAKYYKPLLREFIAKRHESIAAQWAGEREGYTPGSRRRPSGRGERRERL